MTLTVPFPVRSAPPNDGPDATRWQRAAAWARALGGWALAAVAVGGALRLGWAFAAAGPAPSHLHDSAEYIRVAEQMASLRTPTIGGVPSAWPKPGYSVLLVPLVWLSRLTGGHLGVPLLAALANAAMGTATIVLVAVLARQWFGRRAVPVAAWLVALQVPLVLISSTALSEPLVTMSGVATAVVATRAHRSAERPAVRTLVGLGLIIGAGASVRGNGLLLIAVPLLLGWRRGWAEVLRRAAVVSISAGLVLVPWAVRNQVQVGIAAPLSTGSASSLCLSHRDGADGLFHVSDEEALVDCMWGSPWDNADIYRPEDGVVNVSDGAVPVDEVRWYREANDRGVRWAMTHPVEEVRITATKTFEVLTTTTGSISAAEQSGSTIVFPPEQRRVVQLAGDTWMWVTIALTLVALTRLQAARRATAVWSPVVLLTVSMWGGIGLDRYNQPLVPFLAVFAAAAVAASLAVGRPAGPPTDET